MIKLEHTFAEEHLVFTGGEAIKSTEYTGFGAVTEFKYSRDIGDAFRGNNAIKWLANFGKCQLVLQLYTF